jgi:E3 SUMO-protein ligase PIAS1
LNNTPKAVESVTIDVDGRWSIAATATNSPMPDSDDDNYGDEIIEILDSRVTKIKDEAAPSSVSPIAQSSGEASPLTRGGSGKRPISHVIDLTQSDDDDEQLHPSKRTTSFMAPASINSGNGRLPGVPYYDSLPGLDSR